MLTIDNLADFLKASESPIRPQLGSQTRDDARNGPMYWPPEEVQKWLVDQSNTLTCHDSIYFNLSYSLGYLNTLALAAIGGAEAPMAWLARLQAGESQNQAFSEIFGITWDAALPILSNVVSQMAVQAFDPPAAGKYVAKDQKNIVSITGEEGCAVYDAADPQTTRAKIQVLVDGQWLDAPAIEETWSKDSRCARIIDHEWMVTIKLALDHDAQYRFQYLGEVNMGERDFFGRPISQPRRNP